MRPKCNICEHLSPLYRESHKSHFCTGLSENALKQDKVKLEAKLEAVPELIQEGLTVQKIAKILKIPLELVQEKIQQ